MGPNTGMEKMTNEMSAAGDGLQRDQIPSVQKHPSLTTRARLALDTQTDVTLALR